MNDIIESILEKKYPEYATLPIVDDITADDNPREDFWSALSERETYAINAEYLKQTGNPDYDYLVCWEPGRIDDEKESLFDYPTFYEFDVKWWEFQRDATWESIQEQKEWMEQDSKHCWTPDRVAQSINDHNERYKEYEMYCTGDWFRLIENDTFLYAQIISAKWYLFYIVEQVIDDLLDKNIPWSFKGTSDEWLKAINADTPEETYDAGGREKELDSLKEQLRKYTNQDLLDKIDGILKEFNFSGKTFRYDKGYTDTPDEEFNPFTDFIFYDEESLKNVRTTNFLEDFGKHQEDSKELDKIAETLKEEVVIDFARLYDENKSRYI